ncbi:MAG: phosphatidate cytidylyltransferase, partial [Bdellovibrionales bacterium]
EWFQMAMRCKLYSRIAYMLAGAPYVIGAFICAAMIFHQFGFGFALVFLFMVWGSDIGGYFFGKLIGGPKMARAVSPNKTWSGFVGAFIMPGLIGLAGAFAVVEIRHVPVETGFYLAFFCIGILVGIVGQAGDLLISAFKRQAGVKDTGALIPGHGGLLDRVDSLMLAAPVYLLLLSYVRYVF